MKRRVCFWNSHRESGLLETGRRKKTEHGLGAAHWEGRPLLGCDGIARYRNMLSNLMFRSRWVLLLWNTGKLRWYHEVLTLVLETIRFGNGSFYFFCFSYPCKSKVKKGDFYVWTAKVLSHNCNRLYVPKTAYRKFLWNRSVRCNRAV